jgi:hypothetical protein
MTYVGKILVILIMVMSLVFLGVSVTAFVTATNWKDVATKRATDLKTEQGKLATSNAQSKDLEGKLQAALAELATTKKSHDDTIANMQAEAAKAQAEHTQHQTELVDANTNTSLSAAEAKARTEEAAKLRDQVSGLTAMSNALKIEQTEKNVRILTLERQQEALERTGKGLRENLARALTRLRQLGDSTDLARIPASTELPADVEGKVLKVDARTGKSMELSIGSDDGVFTGMELYLFRTEPNAEYLGKVRVGLIEPDQCVATVIGNTVHGKKIKEGDNVSSTLRSK